MSSILPRNPLRKIAFLNVFKENFVAEAAKLNFSEAEVAKILMACETVIFATSLAIKAKQFSKVCHTFRNEKLNGKGKGAGANDIIPTFTPPDAPAELFPSNAVGYLQKIFAIIKLQSAYNETVGANLGIVTPKPAPLVPEEGRPKAKLKALENSVVRIGWTKGKFDGVIVRSRRGDEETWTEIGRDNYSPFIDTRPPLEPSKPEVRRYKLLYMLDDEAIGKESPIYEVVTNP